MTLPYRRDVVDVVDLVAEVTRRYVTGSQRQQCGAFDFATFKRVVATGPEGAAD